MIPLSALLIIYKAWQLIYSHVKVPWGKLSGAGWSYIYPKKSLNLDSWCNNGQHVKDWPRDLLQSIGCGRINGQNRPSRCSVQSKIVSCTCYLDFSLLSFLLLGFHLNSFCMDLAKLSGNSEIFRCLGTVKRKLPDISIRSSNRSAFRAKSQDYAAVNHK